MRFGFDAICQAYLKLELDEQFLGSAIALFKHHSWEKKKKNPHHRSLHIPFLRAYFISRNKTRANQFQLLGNRHPKSFKL